MQTFQWNDEAGSTEETILFAGTRCGICTNSRLLMETLARSAVPSAVSVDTSAPAFTMRLQVHGEHCDLRPVPHFRGQQHIVIASFGSADVFVFDLLRRTVHGAVSRSVACDVEFWRVKLLPIAIGVMSACIGILPVHAACFALDGEGVLIAGDSGAGKSTLSAALCMQGVAYLADDWTYVTQERGELMAHGVAAPIKLLPDAQSYFPMLAAKRPGISMNGELAFEVRPAVELQTGVAYQCMPRRILFLERRPEPGIRFTPLAPEFMQKYLERNVERLPVQMEDAARRRASLMRAVASLPAWKMSYGGAPSFAAVHLQEWMHDWCRVSV